MPLHFLPWCCSSSAGLAGRDDHRSRPCQYPRTLGAPLLSAAWRSRKKTGTREVTLCWPHKGGLSGRDTVLVKAAGTEPPADFSCIEETSRMTGGNESARNRGSALGFARTQAIHVRGKAYSLLLQEGGEWVSRGASCHPGRRRNAGCKARPATAWVVRMPPCAPDAGGSHVYSVLPAS